MTEQEHIELQQEALRTQIAAQKSLALAAEHEFASVQEYRAWVKKHSKQERWLSWTRIALLSIIASTCLVIAVRFCP